VALEIAVDLTQGLQILNREKAAVCQCSIQAGGGVALAENEAIPILPLGIFRINVHFLKIQVSKNLCCGQRTAGVACLGRMGGFNNTHTDLAGSDLQLLLFAGSHKTPPLLFYQWSVFVHIELHIIF